MFLEDFNMPITVAGLQLDVAVGRPATLDETAAAALSYTEVAEVQTVGDYGASFAEVQTTNLKDAIQRFYKGSINYGQLTMGLNYESSDAGQQALSAGNDGANRNSEHTFKLTYQDGSIDYLVGNIFSYTKNASGGADSIVGSSVTIRLNEKPIQVAAP